MLCNSLPFLNLQWIPYSHRFDILNDMEKLFYGPITRGISSSTPPATVSADIDVASRDAGDAHKSAEVASHQGVASAIASTPSFTLPLLVSSQEAMETRIEVSLSLRYFVTYYTSKDILTNF